MLTKQQIKAIADKYVAYMESHSHIQLTILNEYTIEKPYGLIFFYTSKQFKETGDFKYAIAGNAPFLVENTTGRVVNFGTAMADEYYITGYENKTLIPTLDRYWYPETETYSHK